VRHRHHDRADTGAAIILPSWTFDPRATLKAVHDERATSVYGVPAMYVAEFALPDFASFDLTSLRTGMMSGAPCPVELMKRVLNEMHCRELVIAYGQTETSPVTTMSDADDSIEIRVNTVGRAMPADRDSDRIGDNRRTIAHWRTGRGLCARLCADERL